MNKERYILANIPGHYCGVGDQLVRFSTMVHWAHASNRSLIVKSGKGSYYEHKTASFRLPFFLLGNNPLCVYKCLLHNNVFTTSLVLPRRIEGVDIYSIDECSFSLRLKIALGLLKRYCQKIISMLLSRICKPTPIKFDSISLEKLRQNKKIFYVLDCDLNYIQYKLEYTNKCLKEIRLIPELKEIVAEFVKNNFAGKKVIGVHIRYMPPSHSHDHRHKVWMDEDKNLRGLKDAIQKAFDRENPEKTVVFLATDQQHILDYMKKHFGSKLIHRPQKLGDDKTRELHYFARIMSYNELWKNAAVDMFLLSRVDKLLCNSNSWFLLYAKSMVKDSVLI